MNKVYKVIYSKTKNAYVVVSEIARSHTKTKSSKASIGKKLTGLSLAVVTAINIASQSSVNAYRYDEYGGIYDAMENIYYVLFGPNKSDWPDYDTSPNKLNHIISDSEYRNSQYNRKYPQGLLNYLLQNMNGNPINNYGGLVGAFKNNAPQGTIRTILINSVDSSDSSNYSTYGYAFDSNANYTINDTMKQSGSQVRSGGSTPTYTFQAGNNSVLIGNKAFGTGNESVIIGNQARTIPDFNPNGQYTSGSGEVGQSTIIGADAVGVNDPFGFNMAKYGNNGSVKLARNQSTAIGNDVVAAGQATAIGSNVYAVGNSSIAIGNDDNVGYYSVPITGYDYSKYLSLTYDKLNSKGGSRSSTNNPRYSVVVPNYKGQSTTTTFYDNGKRYTREITDSNNGYYKIKDEQGRIIEEFVAGSDGAFDGKLISKTYTNGSNSPSSTVEINAIRYDSHQQSGKSDKAQYSPTISQGYGSIAMGSRALANDTGSTAVGTLAFALKEGSTAIGAQSRAEGIGSIALGNKARVFSDNAIGTGNEVQVKESGAAAYGYRAFATGKNSLALGTNVFANTDLNKNVIVKQNNTTTNSTNFFSQYNGTTVTNEGAYLKNIVAIARGYINGEKTNTIAGKLGTDTVSTVQKEFLNSSTREATSFYEDLLSNKNNSTVGILSPITENFHGINDIAKGIGVDQNKPVNNAIVIGSDSWAGGSNTVALGRGTFSLGENSMALGSYSVANQTNSLSIGTMSHSLGKNSISLGTGANTTHQSDDSIAIGSAAVTEGKSSLSIGKLSWTRGDSNIAIGNNAVIRDMNKVMGTNNTLVASNNNEATSKFNTIIGEKGYIGSGVQYSTALGYNASIGDREADKTSGDYDYSPIKNALALGANTNIYESDDNEVRQIVDIASTDTTSLNKYKEFYKGNNAVAIGYGASATLNNSMALGTNSKTDYSAKDLSHAPWVVPGAISIPTSAQTGVISVGAKNRERRIVNLASGFRDTDAVNVAQLKMAVEKVAADITGELSDGEHYESVNSWNKEGEAYKLSQKVNLQTDYQTYADYLQRLTSYMARKNINGENINDEVLNQLKDRLDKMNEKSKAAIQAAGSAAGSNREYKTIATKLWDEYNKISAMSMDNSLSDEAKSQKLDEKMKEIEDLYNQVKNANVLQTPYSVDELKYWRFYANYDNNLAQGADSLAFGYSAQVAPKATGGIAQGRYAQVLDAGNGKNGQQGIAIGNAALNVGSRNSVAIGSSTQTRTSEDSFVFGVGSKVDNSDQSILLGKGSTIERTKGSILLGAESSMGTDRTENQSQTFTMPANTVRIGSGYYDEAKINELKATSDTNRKIVEIPVDFTNGSKNGVKLYYMSTDIITIGGKQVPKEGASPLTTEKLNELGVPQVTFVKENATGNQRVYTGSLNNNEYNIAIGNKLTVRNANYGTVLGYDSGIYSADNAVVMGRGSNVKNGERSLAIGTFAKVEGEVPKTEAQKQALTTEINNINNKITQIQNDINAQKAIESNTNKTPQERETARTTIEAKQIELQKKQAEKMRKEAERDGHTASNSVAIGDDANVIKSKQSIALGKAAKVDTNSQNSIALGNGVIIWEKVQDSVAIGSGAWIGGSTANAIALGKGAYVNNESHSSIAIGDGAKIESRNTLNSIALGKDAKINGNNTNNGIAIGYDAKISGSSNNAIAIGTGAEVQTGAANSIALGSRSWAWQEANNNNIATSFGGTYSLNNEGVAKTNNGLDYTALLSIGNGNTGKIFTRRIVNLAAGVRDTDAVNVAQLKSLASNEISFIAQYTPKDAKAATVTNTSKVALGTTSNEEAKLGGTATANQTNLQFTFQGEGGVKVSAANKVITFSPEDTTIITDEGDKTLSLLGKTISFKAKGKDEDADQENYDGENIATWIDVTADKNVAAVKLGLAKTPRFDALEIGAKNTQGAPTQITKLTSANGVLTLSQNGTDKVRLTGIKTPDGNNNYDAVNVEYFKNNIQSSKMKYKVNSNGQDKVTSGQSTNVPVEADFLNITQGDGSANGHTANTKIPVSDAKAGVVIADAGTGKVVIGLSDEARSKLDKVLKNENALATIQSEVDGSPMVYTTAAGDLIKKIGGKFYLAQAVGDKKFINGKFYTPDQFNDDGSLKNNAVATTLQEYPANNKIIVSALGRKGSATASATILGNVEGFTDGNTAATFKSDASNNTSLEIETKDGTIADKKYTINIGNKGKITGVQSGMTSASDLMTKQSTVKADKDVLETVATLQDIQTVLNTGINLKGDEAGTNTTPVKLTKTVNINGESQQYGKTNTETAKLIKTDIKAKQDNSGNVDVQLSLDTKKLAQAIGNAITGTDTDATAGKTALEGGLSLSYKVNDDTTPKKTSLTQGLTFKPATGDNAGISISTDATNNGVVNIGLATNIKSAIDSISNKANTTDLENYAKLDGSNLTNTDTSKPKINPKNWATALGTGTITYPQKEGATVPDTDGQLVTGTTVKTALGTLKNNVENAISQKGFSVEGNTGGSKKVQLGETLNVSGKAGGLITVTSSKTGTAPKLEIAIDSDKFTEKAKAAALSAVTINATGKNITVSSTGTTEKAYTVNLDKTLVDVNSITSENGSDLTIARKDSASITIKNDQVDIKNGTGANAKTIIIGKDGKISGVAEAQSDSDVVVLSQLTKLGLNPNETGTNLKPVVTYDDSTKTTISLGKPAQNGQDKVLTKITNLANGTIGTDSVDAVNGSQIQSALTSIQSALGGTGTVTNGQVTTPTYSLKAGANNATNVNGVGNALTTLDNAITTLTNNANTAKITITGDKPKVNSEAASKELKVNKTFNISGVEQATGTEATDKAKLITTTIGQGATAGDVNVELTVDTTNLAKAILNGANGQDGKNGKDALLDGLTISYRANGASDTAAQKVSLAKGLDFVTGTGKAINSGNPAAPIQGSDKIHEGITIATGDDGKVVIGLNQATKTAIDKVATNETTIKSLSNEINTIKEGGANTMVYTLENGEKVTKVNNKLYKVADITGKRFDATSGKFYDNDQFKPDGTLKDNPKELDAQPTALADNSTVIISAVNQKDGSTIEPVTLGNVNAISNKQNGSKIEFMSEKDSKNTSLKITNTYETISDDGEKKENLSEIEIGKGGKITGLVDGEIKAGSKDAITGGQLHAIKSKVDQLAGGEITAAVGYKVNNKGVDKTEENVVKDVPIKADFLNFVEGNGSDATANIVRTTGAAKEGIVIANGSDGKVVIGLDAATRKAIDNITKGADGVNGTPGTDGADGAAGTPATGGAIGPKGQDGLNGTAGKNGSSLADKVEATRDGLTGNMVYTTSDGTRVKAYNGKYYSPTEAAKIEEKIAAKEYTKANNGYYYSSSDVNEDGSLKDPATAMPVDFSTVMDGANKLATPLGENEVFISAVRSDGSTTKPISLRNIQTVENGTTKLELKDGVLEVTTQITNTGNDSANNPKVSNKIEIGKEGKITGVKSGMGTAENLVSTTDADTLGTVATLGDVQKIASAGFTIAADTGTRDANTQKEVTEKTLALTKKLTFTAQDQEITAEVPAPATGGNATPAVNGKLITTKVSSDGTSGDVKVELGINTTNLVKAIVDGKDGKNGKDALIKGITLGYKANNATTTETTSLFNGLNFVEGNGTDATKTGARNLTDVKDGIAIATTTDGKIVIGLDPTTKTAITQVSTNQNDITKIKNEILNKSANTDTSKPLVYTTTTGEKVQEIGNNLYTEKSLEGKRYYNGNFYNDTDFKNDGSLKENATAVNIAPIPDKTKLIISAVNPNNGETIFAEEEQADGTNIKISKAVQIGNTKGFNDGISSVEFTTDAENNTSLTVKTTNAKVGSEVNTISIGDKGKITGVQSGMTSAETLLTKNIANPDDKKVLNTVATLKDVQTVLAAGINLAGMDDASKKAAVNLPLTKTINIVGEEQKVGTKASTEPDAQPDAKVDDNQPLINTTVAKADGNSGNVDVKLSLDIKNVAKALGQAIQDEEKSNDKPVKDALTNALTLSYKASDEGDKKSTKLADGLVFTAGSGTSFTAPQDNPTAQDSNKTKTGIAITTGANGTVTIGLDNETRKKLDSMASTSNLDAYAKLDGTNLVKEKTTGSTEKISSLTPEAQVNWAIALGTGTITDPATGQPIPATNNNLVTGETVRTALNSVKESLTNAGFKVKGNSGNLETIKLGDTLEVLGDDKILKVKSVAATKNPEANTKLEITLDKGELAKAVAGEKGAAGFNGTNGLDGKDGLANTSLKDRVEALRSGTAGNMVYTDSAGNRLENINGKYYNKDEADKIKAKVTDGTYKVANDGYYYEAGNVDADGNPQKNATPVDFTTAMNGADKLATPLAENEVYISAVRSDGSTIEPIALRNVSTISGNGVDIKTVKTDNDNTYLEVKSKYQVTTQEDGGASTTRNETSTITIGKGGKISGIEAGTAEKDAVNYGQLSALETKVTNLGTNSYIDIAGDVEVDNAGTKTKKQTLNNAKQLTITGIEQVVKPEEGTENTQGYKPAESKQLIKSTVEKDGTDGNVKVNLEIDTANLAKAIVNGVNGADGKDALQKGLNINYKVNNATNKTPISLHNGFNFVEGNGKESGNTPNPARTSANAKAGIVIADGGEGKIVIGLDDSTRKAIDSITKGADGVNGTNGQAGTDGVGTTGPRGKDGYNNTSLGTKVDALRDGLAGNMVYTDKDGNRLENINGKYYTKTEAAKITADSRYKKANNGYYYEASKVDADGNLIDKAAVPVDFATVMTTDGATKLATPLDDNNVFISAVKSDGSTTDTVALRNIASLEGSDSKVEFVKDKDTNKTSLKITTKVQGENGLKDHTIEIGKDGKITNLADGTIGENSTDAVTGSQIQSALSSIATALGGNSTVNNGSVTAPSYSLNTKADGSQKKPTDTTTEAPAFTNVGAALDALDKGIGKNVTDISTIKQNITNLTSGGLKVAGDSTNNADVKTVQLGKQVQITGATQELKPEVGTKGSPGYTAPIKEQLIKATATQDADNGVKVELELSTDNLGKAIVNNTTVVNELTDGLKLTYKVNGRDEKTTSLNTGLDFVAGTGTINKAIPDGANADVTNAINQTNAETTKAGIEITTANDGKVVIGLAETTRQTIDDTATKVETINNVVNNIKLAGSNSMVYTLEDGTKVTKLGNSIYKLADVENKGYDETTNKFYALDQFNPDGTLKNGATEITPQPTALAGQKVIISAVNQGDGSTTDPVTLGNIDVISNKKDGSKIEFVTDATGKNTSLKITNKYETTTDAGTKKDNLSTIEIGKDGKITGVQSATEDNDVVILKQLKDVGIDPTLTGNNLKPVVTYDDASKTTITLGTPKTANADAVTTKITGLTDATLSDTSTDAVTGKQLHSVMNQLGLGGNTTTENNNGAAGKDGLNGKSIIEKVQGLRDGTAGNMVYTKEDGTRLSRVGNDFYVSTEIAGKKYNEADQKWYPADQFEDNGNLKNNATGGQTITALLATEKVIISAVDGKTGETTTATAIRNVGSGLVADTTIADLVDNKSRTKITGKDDSVKELTPQELNTVATIGDLQKVAQAGLNFAGDDDTSTATPVNAMLTEKVTITGAKQKVGTTTKGTTSTDEKEQLITTKVTKADKNVTVELSVDTKNLAKAILNGENGTDGKNGKDALREGLNLSYRVNNNSVKSETSLLDGLNFVQGNGTAKGKTIANSTTAATEAKAGVVVTEAGNGTIVIGLDADTRAALDSITKGTDGVNGKDGQPGTDGVATTGPKGQDGLNSKSVNEQLSAIRSGLAGSMVYTDGDGNRLENINGKFYTKEEAAKIKADDRYKLANNGYYYEKGKVDPNGNLVDKNAIPVDFAEVTANGTTDKLATPMDDKSVLISAVNADGTTTKPVSIRNVSSLENGTTKLELKDGALEVTTQITNTGDDKDTNPKVANTIKIGEEGKITGVKSGMGTAADLINSTNDATLGTVATLGDVQKIASAGLNFTGDDAASKGTPITTKLGNKVNITGANQVVEDAVGTKGSPDYKAAKEVQFIKSTVTSDGADGVNVTLELDTTKLTDAIINGKDGVNGKDALQKGLNITYRANSQTDTDAKKISLEKGLDFVAGTGKAITTGTPETSIKDSDKAKKGIEIVTGDDGKVIIGLSKDARDKIDEAAKHGKDGKDGLAGNMVYTDGDGNKLIVVEDKYYLEDDAKDKEKGTDGKFYDPADLDENKNPTQDAKDNNRGTELTPVATEEVVISTAKPGGDTSKPTKITNVESGLGSTTISDLVDGNKKGAETTPDGTITKPAEKLEKELNTVVTVKDLQTLAKAGINFTANSDVNLNDDNKTINTPIGKTIEIVGSSKFDTQQGRDEYVNEYNKMLDNLDKNLANPPSRLAGFMSGFSSDNIFTYNDGGKLRISMSKNPVFDTIRVDKILNKDGSEYLGNNGFYIKAGDSSYFVPSGGVLEITNDKNISVKVQPETNNLKPTTKTETSATTPSKGAEETTTKAETSVAEKPDTTTETGKAPQEVDTGKVTGPSTGVIPAEVIATNKTVPTKSSVQIGLNANPTIADIGKDMIERDEEGNIIKGGDLITNVNYVENRIQNIAGATQEIVTKLDNRISTVQKNASAGTAAAMAAAQIPQVLNTNKQHVLGIGFGRYKSEKAYALGLSGSTNNKDFLYKIGATYDSSRTLGFSIGLGVAFGPENRKLTDDFRKNDYEARLNKQEEVIKQLTSENRNLINEHNTKIEKLESQNAELKAQVEQLVALLNQTLNK